MKENIVVVIPEGLQLGSVLPFPANNREVQGLGGWGSGHDSGLLLRTLHQVTILWECNEYRGFFIYYSNSI